MKKLLLAGVAIIGMTSLSITANAQQSAVATVIDNNAAELGEIKIKQAPNGILLHVNLEGLPAGKHGFHIHETGTCEDHDKFTMAHGHIGKGDDVKHGLMNPDGYEEGDLPNLIVSKDGTVEVELYVNDLKIADADDMNDDSVLLDDDGAAFMIHANPDDHMTQPIGGAGDRIACGVIQSSKMMVPPVTRETSPEADIQEEETSETEATKPEITVEKLEEKPVQPTE